MQNNKRKRWSKEEKVRIVLEGMQGEDHIVGICRRYEVATRQWYRWRDAFVEKGEEGLEDHRRVGKCRSHPLEVENRRLLHLVGRQALMLEEQKKFLDLLQGRTKKEWLMNSEIKG